MAPIFRKTRLAFLMFCVGYFTTITVNVNAADGGSVRVYGGACQKETGGSHLPPVQNPVTNFC